jgi:hypothetical protein
MGRVLMLCMNVLFWQSDCKTHIDRYLLRPTPAKQGIQLNSGKALFIQNYRSLRLRTTQLCHTRFHHHRLPIRIIFKAELCQIIPIKSSLYSCSPSEKDSSPPRESKWKHVLNNTCKSKSQIQNVVLRSPGGDICRDGIHQYFYNFSIFFLSFF